MTTKKKWDGAPNLLPGIAAPDSVCSGSALDTPI